jgi:hypothetical protein
MREILKLAENNRSELEKVLKYYSHHPGDSLKLRAAEFLILNMPGKYSEDERPSEVFFPLFREWDSIFHIGVADRKKTFDSLVTIYRLASEKKYLPDLLHIEAGYLIDQIELAFRVREEMPWSRDIPFDRFCREILPYRLRNERLEPWRSQVLEEYAGFIDSMKSICGTDAVLACSLMNVRIRIPWRGSFPVSPPLPSFTYAMAKEAWAGTCQERSVVGLSIMRAIGIPVTEDFTPQWANRQKGHDWNTVADTTGRHIIFMSTDSHPGAPHMANPDRDKMAKAFRRTYEIQKESLAMLADDITGIPPFFRDPCFTDVTAENFDCGEIRLTLDDVPGMEQGYAYLYIFNNKNWIPIHWGKTEGREVAFTDMGKGITYLPACYHKKKMYPAGYPVIFTKEGTLQHLVPDTARTQKMALLRKHPIYMGHTDRMKGGRFEGANDPDFRDARLLYTIDFHPDMYFHTVSLKESYFRYYRYLSPDGGACNIAELEFCDREGNKLKGNIIGTPGSYANDPMRSLDKAFDGNTLTFYDAAEKDGAWVGMDFGKRTGVDHIRYLPRNDDNMIRVGQAYELFFWTRNGWQSLGRQTAKEQVLHFDGPSGALFLLRNLSGGTEERIFTYENGKQVWW